MRYKELDLAGMGRLARSLAASKGDGPLVIGLVGQLGAGKTTFTQALARALGGRRAKSPTFTVLNTYPGRRVNLHHVDLYRLDRPSQLKAIGLEDAVSDAGAVTCIEWADKFPALLKKCDLTVRIETTTQGKRNVTVTGVKTSGARRAAGAAGRKPVPRRSGRA